MLASSMKKLALLLVGASLLGACKKESENTPTRTDLLIAKSWRVAALRFTTTNPGNGPSTIDGYASVSACERDDFTKFNADKTLTADEGATKCDSSDPQTMLGAWNFNNDYTKLTITDPSQSSVAVPFDVVELSANVLYLRTSSTSSTGGVTTTVTYDIVYAAL